MKIVFFGTPEYVAPIANAIHNNFKTTGVKSPIVGVITQKPRPVGRKKIVTHSPMDNWAYKKEIPLFYSTNKFLQAGLKADLAILAAYGEIINKKIINYFPHGILNIHPSILPKYRGASPIQAAITTGDKQTGVSIIKLDEKLDHGPIVSQFTQDIADDDTGGSLREKLFEQSSKVIIPLIKPYLAGKIKLKKQNHQEATFTKTITKNDAFIDPKYIDPLLSGIKIKKDINFPFIKDSKFNITPKLIDRFIKAMKPWPVAWTLVTKKENNETSKLRLKLIAAHVDSSSNKLVPEKVQLEGKNEVSWDQYKNSYANATFE